MGSTLSLCQISHTRSFGVRTPTSAILQKNRTVESNSSNVFDNNNAQLFLPPDSSDWAPWPQTGRRERVSGPKNACVILLAPLSVPQSTTDLRDKRDWSSRSRLHTLCVAYLPRDTTTTTMASSDVVSCCLGNITVGTWPRRHQFHSAVCIFYIRHGNSEGQWLFTFFYWREMQLSRKCMNESATQLWLLFKQTGWFWTGPKESTRLGKQRQDKKHKVKAVCTKTVRINGNIINEQSRAKRNQDFLNTGQWKGCLNSESTCSSPCGLKSTPSILALRSPVRTSRAFQLTNETVSSLWSVCVWHYIYNYTLYLQLNWNVWFWFNIYASGF